MPAGTALDEAQVTLSSLTLFGDPALMTLRSLVNEGHRIRIELSAIHALMRRQAAGAGATPGTDTSARTGAAPEAHADTGPGDRRARSPSGCSSRSRGSSSSRRERSRETGTPRWRWSACRRAEHRGRVVRAGARGVAPVLARRSPRWPDSCAPWRAWPLPPGRAVACESAGRVATPIDPRARGGRTGPAARQRQPRLAGGRHAVRLTVVVLVCELISRHLPLSRGYWIVVAAAATLRPEFGATFTRGTERAVGTCLGVGWPAGSPSPCIPRAR